MKEREWFDKIVTRYEGMKSVHHSIKVLIKMLHSKKCWIDKNDCKSARLTNFLIKIEYDVEVDNTNTGSNSQVLEISILIKMLHRSAPTWWHIDDEIHFSDYPFHFDAMK